MFKAILVTALLLGATVPGHSQLLSFGVKGGVPLTDALNGSSDNGAIVSTSTGRWLVGPTVELHLPFRLSVEVDALYRRESYSVSSTSTTGIVTASEWFDVAPTATATNFSHSLNSLQFPFLAKYELHGGFVRPYIDGGVTYRYLFGDGPINNGNTAGVSIGGGILFKLLLLRLSPEIRYTHWAGNNIYAPYVTDSQNQLDFLVGFSF